MTTVAFLQNQWFRNPERVREIFARRPEDREYYISAFLFMGCLTGQRLQKAFGEELCEEIIWEEQSPEIGDKASAKFMADKQHIQRVIDKHQPESILTFGVAASAALVVIKESTQADWRLICGPHPAARLPDIMQRLENMRQQLLYDAHS